MWFNLDAILWWRTSLFGERHPLEVRFRGIGSSPFQIEEKELINVEYLGWNLVWIRTIAASQIYSFSFFAQLLSAIFHFYAIR